MRTTILFFGLFTACGQQEETKTESTSDENEKEFGFSDNNDNNDDTENTDNTDNTEDTAEEEPPLVLSEGRWILPEAEVISDVCNVGNFNENLTETVPSEVYISNSSETSFFLDNETECEILGVEFICEKQELEQETWGATIAISNIMYGTISDENNINILFDVELISCSDSVICLGMEAVLNLPCLIELETTGEKD